MCALGFLFSPDTVGCGLPKSRYICTVITPQIAVMQPTAVKSQFLLSRIQSIEDSGIFSNRGPQVRELESRLANWLNVPLEHLVVTSSATTALQAAVALSPATSWHLPSWSFPATALAPLGLGRRVTFVDVDPLTWIATDQRISEKEGLIKVVPFGGSVESEVWSDTGEVVIDAAASLASQPKGLAELPVTTAIVFSLHATKTMGGAEGGVIVFGSVERAQAARSWINFGFSGGRESTVVGTNGKMSEYDAAVANARLDGWAEESFGWLRVRQLATETSQTLDLSETPDSMSSISPYWIVLFKSVRERNKVWMTLEKEQVETRLWWGKGLHNMAAFSDVPKTNLFVTKDLSERYLGLPHHLFLKQQDYSRIHQLVAETIGQPERADRQ